MYCSNHKAELNRSRPTQTDFKYQFTCLVEKERDLRQFSQWSSSPQQFMSARIQSSISLYHQSTRLTDKTTNHKNIPKSSSQAARKFSEQGLQSQTLLIRNLTMRLGTADRMIRKRTNKESICHLRLHQGTTGSTYPYSGTKMMLASGPFCSICRCSTRVHKRSMHSLSCSKTGFIGSGHCEA